MFLALVVVGRWRWISGEVVVVVVMLYEAPYISMIFKELCATLSSRRRVEIVRMTE